MDALYFRVSSDRQTTENQFDELITAARAGDPARDVVPKMVIPPIRVTAAVKMVLCSSVMI